MSLQYRFSDGADTLRQAIRAQVVGVTLAKHAPAFALLFVPPALWAAFERERSLAAHLTWPLIPAVLSYAAVARRPLPGDLRAAEAMASIAAVFLIACLAMTPAFLSLGFSFTGALFEAMSGLTTTGLSVAADPDNWPFAVHFLRSWLQWIGGLVMATAVLALILPAGLATLRLGSVGIDQGDRIASTRAKARQLLGVYAGLTLVMAAATALIAPSVREALVLTLSAISTGGFAPRADSLSSYSVATQTVVIATCLLGTISLLSYALIAKGDFRGAWRLGSGLRVIAALLVFGGLAIAFALASGLRDVSEIYGTILNIVSAMTTAGYSASPLPGTGPLLVLFLLAMVLGGDSGSTGGGVKLARAGLLFRTFRHAFRAPTLPERAVAPLRMDGVKVESSTIVGVMALVFIYIGALFALLCHFGLHGYAFADSLFESVSALSTVGLSVGLVGPDLPWDLKLSLTLAMWLGRLEFIAVLVLLWPANWMKGK